jgi:hypothetical protein
LNSNRAALAGWQTTVWRNYLVQNAAALRSRDLQRVQRFYTMLEKLDHFSTGDKTTEALTVLFQLLTEKKPEIGGSW